MENSPFLGGDQLFILVGLDFFESFPHDQDDTHHNAHKVHFHLHVPMTSLIQDVPVYCLKGYPSSPFEIVSRAMISFWSDANSYPPNMSFLNASLLFPLNPAPSFPPDACEVKVFETKQILSSNIVNFSNTDCGDKKKQDSVPVSLSPHLKYFLPLEIAVQFSPPIHYEWWWGGGG